MLSILPVLLHLLFGPLECHSFFLNQVVYNMKIIDVFLGKKPVPLFILFWFNDIKLLFPEPDQRGVDIEHFSHFTNGIIELFNLDLLIGHVVPDFSK